MALSPGSKLDHYDILSQLGAGGMGEVYRARDARIGRDVAVKVLPSSYATDTDRLRRFEQEARAIGFLNHPNILSIYDVGKSDGSPYFVCELLEGETLREKLRSGRIPPRKAIEYGLQITQGLAAAHEKGIIHRDLKPENVFITKDGRAKILDFGLAKLAQHEKTKDEQSKLETAAGSEPGVVLGTMGYMSPEQVRGQPSDHRTDLFALGAILYEMLTGQRAFQGATTADTISAILHKDPPELSTNNLDVPPALVRIIEHCLEKNLQERFDTAHDLAFALETIPGVSATQPVVQQEPKTIASAQKAWKWIAALILVAGLSGAIGFSLRKSSTDRVLQLEMRTPEGVSITDSPVISPDGSGVVFTASDKSGKSGLWYRSFDSQNARMLPGTDGAVYPFWSPDSRYIAFFAEGKLRKIDISGGPSQEISDAPEPRGGAWNNQDVILFSPFSGVGLYRTSASGGTRTRITSVDKSAGETSHRFPSFLPDGIHYLYFCWAQAEKLQRGGIYLGSLNSKETKFLFRSEHPAVYVPPGYLLFNQSDTLMAVRFNKETLELDGQPFPLMQNVWFSTIISGNRTVSASNNGTLALLTGSFLKELRWYDRSGNPAATGVSPADIYDVRFSADDKRIAISMNVPAGGNEGSLWLFDITAKNMFRFTFNRSNNLCPVWSPDGTKLLFASDRSGNDDIYIKDSTGAETESLLLKSDHWLLPNDWIANPETIVYEEINPDTKYDLWILPFSGDRKPQPLLRTAANEAQARVSRDGNWIAYCSDESGQPEIYVQPFLKNNGAKWQVSVNGGTSPKWRADGKELFYLSNDRKIMSIEIKDGGSFIFASPKCFFKHHRLFRHLL